MGYRRNVVGRCNPRRPACNNLPHRFTSEENCRFIDSANCDPVCLQRMLAVLSGFIGYVAAVMGLVWLVGPIAENVPEEKHIPFLVDLWAHNASYLAGFVGGIILMTWVWRSRRPERAQ